MLDEKDYIQRATKAYCRRCKKEGGIADSPSNMSEVLGNSGGPYFVVLRGGGSSSGILAVYRIVGHAHSPASLKWLPRELYKKSGIK
jgi:hypothetical protein